MRDTTTGRQHEERVGQVLASAGITAKAQVEVGSKPGGGTHLIDHLVQRPQPANGRELLLSCKWQNVNGTAEEKIPYEVAKLAYSVKSDPARFGDYAALLIEGPGWSPGMLEYVRTELPKDFKSMAYVRVYFSVEDFMAKEFPGVGYALP